MKKNGVMERVNEASKFPQRTPFSVMAPRMFRRLDLLIYLFKKRASKNIVHNKMYSGELHDFFYSYMCSVKAIKIQAVSIEGKGEKRTATVLEDRWSNR